MDQEINQIKISQLPEKDKINETDYFIVDDLNDTWKVPFGYINNYIDTQVEKEHNFLDESLNNIQGLVEDIEKTQQDTNDTLQSITETEESHEKNEIIRQQNELNRVSEFDVMKSTIEEFKSLNIPETFDEFSIYIDQVKIDEEIRQNNEIQRGLSETERENYIEEVKSFIETVENSENSRVAAETSRINEFNDIKDFVDNFKVDVLDNIYPVGSVYHSSVDIDPGTLFGGIWESNHYLYTFEEVNTESGEIANTTSEYHYSWIRIS